ncbi:MAG: hotdog family protein [Caldilineaceae bacterium]
MRTPIELPMAELVPHAGNLRLLDAAIDGDEESLVAQVQIREDSLFFDGEGIGAWVGIEYMAQAVAAWAGWRARLAGGEPHIGFLLGSRNFRCDAPRFALGQVLCVQAHRQFQADNGLGQFDCSISIDGQCVAQAALTVFQPEDAMGFLKRGAA